MVTFAALELSIYSTIHSEVFVNAPYTEFIGNGYTITEENKVNKVADKFRFEYGAEIYCFLS